MASSRSANGNEANAAEQKLLESALTLFSEKGYEGTSIREIIESAGVTRPVLYYYFENKEDLYRRLVETKFSELIGEIERIKASISDSIACLKAIICRTFELTEENTEAVRLILQVFFSPPQCGPELDRSKLGPRRFKLIEEVMREGLEKGELAGGDSRSLTLVFLGIMDMHVMAKSDRPDVRLTCELGEGLVDLLFHGAGWKADPPTALTSPFTASAAGDSL